MTSKSDENDASEIGVDSIESGISELNALYQHDYSSSMPGIRAGGGLNAKDAERIGRLMGVIIKQPAAIEVQINPDQARTGSHYGYIFDEEKLKDKQFIDSWRGAFYGKLYGELVLLNSKGIEIGHV